MAIPCKTVKLFFLIFFFCSLDTLPFCVGLQCVAIIIKKFNKRIAIPFNFLVMCNGDNCLN